MKRIKEKSKTHRYHKRKPLKVLRMYFVGTNIVR